jgi:hypothetical protein
VVGPIREVRGGVVSVVHSVMSGTMRRHAPTRRTSAALLGQLHGDRNEGSSQGATGQWAESGWSGGPSTP